MRSPDVVVVGVGRTGTSFTAHVLQERLGVCMAHEYEKADTEVRGGFPHPVGGYEELYEMMMFTDYLVSWKHWKQVPWLDCYSAIHSECSGLIGIKQTRLARAQLEHWQMIAPRLVVRTYRQVGPTVDSFIRWREPRDRIAWEAFYWEREGNLREVVDNPSFPFKVVRVDYREQVEEEKLVERLRPFVEAL